VSEYLSDGISESIIDLLSEPIGVLESIAAMILRHTNDRVTRKHYIKPAPVKAIAAMRQLSETFSKVETPKHPNYSQMLPSMLPKLSKRTNPKGASRGFSKRECHLNA